VLEPITASEIPASSKKEDSARADFLALVLAFVFGFERLAGHEILTKEGGEDPRSGVSGGGSASDAADPDVPARDATDSDPAAELRVESEDEERNSNCMCAWWALRGGARLSGLSDPAPVYSYDGQKAALWRGRRMRKWQMARKLIYERGAVYIMRIYTP
jgi:hypothetical protein